MNSSSLSSMVGNGLSGLCRKTSDTEHFLFYNTLQVVGINPQQRVLLGCLKISRSTVGIAVGSCYASGICR